MPVTVQLQPDQNKHESDVTCVKFYKGNLYSCGGDGKIKVWYFVWHKLYEHYVIKVKLSSLNFLKITINFTALKFKKKNCIFTVLKIKEIYISISTIINFFMILDI